MITTFRILYKNLRRRDHQTDTYCFKIPAGRVSHCIYPVIIGCTFLFMVIWSWRKWTDPIIDMGRELYIPWQITQGKVLYKDIASLYGPFSSYLNALFFKVFGVSLNTLIFCNMGIVLFFTAVLYQFFRRISNRLTAMAICLFFLCVFAFSQYGPISNYNFVTPYSHEAVHGLIATVTMIFALHQFGVKRILRYAFIAGCSFGITLLTKPEIAIASTVSVILWVSLFLAYHLRLKIPSFQFFLTFISGMLIFPAVFIIGFTIHGDYTNALKVLCGMWVPLLHGTMINNVFYMTLSGFNNVGKNVLLLLLSSAKIIIGLLVLLVTSVVIGRFSNTRRRWIIWVVNLFFLSVLLFFTKLIKWDEFYRALPLMMIVSGVFLFYRFFKEKTDWKKASIPAVSTVWSVFSLVMLGKIILNSQITHYGFYLALPATLLSLWMLIWFIPERVIKAPVAALNFRLMTIVLITVAIVSHLNNSQKFYRLKTFTLGNNNDVLLTYSPSFFPLAAIEQDALEFIKSTASPGDAIVVLPEGAMINYLIRHPNPTPYLNYLPPEMSYYGENAMISTMKEHRPEFIMFVRRNLSEYGENTFGASPHYGKQMLDWINQEYMTAKLIGSDPLEIDGTGIKIMKLKSRL